MGRGGGRGQGRGQGRELGGVVGRGVQALVLGVQVTEGGGELVAVVRQESRRVHLGKESADQSWTGTELTRTSRSASTSSLALTISPLFRLYSFSRLLLASSSILSW